MTTEELMTVRSLNMRIRRLEQKLAGLRLLITNVTPIMDVTPRSQRLESKVEWLAVRALDLEHELDDLRGQLSARRITLTEAILSEPVEAVVQSLLIMFYVECRSMPSCARELNYSLRQTYRVHREYLKRCHGVAHCGTSAIVVI